MAGKKDVKKSPKKASPKKASPKKTSPKKKSSDDEEWVCPSVVEDSTVTEAEQYAKTNPPTNYATVCETKY
jgi:hypothetical protein